VFQRISATSMCVFMVLG